MSDAICSIPGCEKAARQLGWCPMHRGRAERTGSPLTLPLHPIPPEVRFWAKVDKTSSCWLWTGSRTRKGYGRFSVRAGDQRLAHRYSYELLREPIPAGLTIDHLCRVRNCVNPDHLEPVTTAVNVLRGEGVSAQAARKTHCVRGHLLPEPNEKGKRKCRPCQHLHSARSWALKKAARQ